MNKLLGFMGIVVAGGAYLYHQNKHIEMTHHIISHPQIPIEFDNYKILQFSDFHNKFVGYYPNQLIDKIKQASPDIIVISGDLIDSYHPNFDYAKKIVEQLLQIAPVYYVTGNHEWRMKQTTIDFIHQLVDLGVVFMDNHHVRLNYRGANIDLYGVPDLNYIIDAETSHDSGYEKEYLKYIEPLINANDHYKILLAHRPEMFEVYQQLPMHLVFTGHAHGGQWRVIGTEGLYAPSQGIMPKYTSGKHQQNGTTMIVSRGLGSSSFPIRLWNYPELIVVTLKHQSSKE